jgi:hypothetical protein
MDNFRNNISKKIVESRPNLSPSSLKTYVSTLYNLHKHLKQDHNNIDWFSTDFDKIVDYLKDMASASRKSVLSALFVITNDSKYRELMLKDCKEVNDNYRNQKRNTKQENNWISVEEIKSKYDELHTKVKQMFGKVLVGSPATVIEYLLIALLSGAIIPPRRNLDYSLMKIRSYDTKTDNYYKNGKLYFNKYKTSDKYGEQILEIPKELNTIIKNGLK